MPSQVITSVENNFTKGLITESTGLNFPENAATDCDNCEFTLVGDTLRREGIDLEVNYALNDLGARSFSVTNFYKWNNAGGDGNTQIIVVQNADTLYFFKSTAATSSAPLSTTKLASTISLSSFLPTGSTKGSLIPQAECQYSDGNGYLFVFHPYLEPFYCTYSSGTITGNAITIQTRDFVGVTETNVPVNFRPPSLSTVHSYNLQNQGWQTAGSWTATSTSSPNLQTDVNGNWTVTNTTFQIQNGLTIPAGSYVTIYGSLVFTRDAINVTILGQVNSYSGTSLAITVLSCITSPQAKAIYNNLVSANWSLSSAAANNQINSWNSALGNYPSNADIWWLYKDSTGVFNPLSTINNFPAPTSPAAKGHFLLNEFNQQRSTVSNLTTITDVTTMLRPKTGTWFQGRVWYTGVDDSFAATGTAPYTTWTENIYFSQTVENPTQFGKCYQSDDPTDQNFNQLLPTDGGVIVIQGSGSIFKLFPIVNGMLVFAANGVWFITGSQGIGFTANDYTITKISSIETISSTSFVDVMGYPYFWNEEGIYQVTPDPRGASLTVEPITVGTILSFYNNIPKQSKKFVRGSYDPIDYVIKWVYRSSNTDSVGNLYIFDKILNYNVYNKSFYPYTVDTTSAAINGVMFIQSPGGSNTPTSGFKFLVSFINLSNWVFSFADEHDSNYVDWASTGIPINFVSYFITGYKLHGQGQKRFDIPYIYMFSRNSGPAQYYIQSIWNYATDRNSNRWSTRQRATLFDPHFGVIFKRHRLRGHGLTLQFKISSVDGQPFDIIGWSVYENVNQGI